MSDKLYETRDLALAAALVTLGYSPKALIHWKDKTFTFQMDMAFNDGKALEQKYYALLLEVPAKTFTDTIRKIRSMVHDETKRLGL